mgnify:CR=1 FL=1
MKKIFDSISEDLSKVVTEKYSTSFSIATKLIDNSIRQDIYNVYGFVRIADEIVDSFHQYPKKEILDSLEEDESMEDEMAAAEDELLAALPAPPEWPTSSGLVSLAES